MSKNYMTDANNFLEVYVDALKCVEESAERKQQYAHYNATAKSLTEAI